LGNAHCQQLLFMPLPLRVSLSTHTHTLSQHLRQEVGSRAPSECYSTPDLPTTYNPSALRPMSRAPATRFGASLHAECRVLLLSSLLSQAIDRHWFSSAPLGFLSAQAAPPSRYQSDRHPPTKLPSCTRRRPPRLAPTRPDGTSSCASRHRSCGTSGPPAGGSKGVMAHELRLATPVRAGTNCCYRCALQC
jgi:hypothetical protein